MSTLSLSTKNFSNILKIWPQSYLPFPIQMIRGHSPITAIILLQNLTNKVILFRIVRDEESKVNLKAKPGIGLIAPYAEKEIELLLNGDGFKPTLADYIYVEALIYEFDIKQGIDDIEKNLSIHNWSSYLKDKQVEYYGLKCYETNCMECISVSKELFHTQFKQQKVNHNDNQMDKSWITALLFLILMIIVIFFVIYWFHQTKNYQTLTRNEVKLKRVSNNLNHLLSLINSTCFYNQKDDFLQTVFNQV